MEFLAICFTLLMPLGFIGLQHHFYIQSKKQSDPVKYFVDQIDSHPWYNIKLMGVIFMTMPIVAMIANLFDGSIFDSSIAGKDWVFIFVFFFLWPFMGFMQYRLYWVYIRKLEKIDGASKFNDIHHSWIFRFLNYPAYFWLFIIVALIIVPLIVYVWEVSGVNW